MPSQQARHGMLSRKALRGSLTRLPSCGFTKLAQNCWYEPRELVFHDVVVSSREHHLNRKLLTDSARDHDKGHMGNSFLRDSERFGSAKPGQLIVSENDVERVRKESLGHRSG